MASGLEEEPGTKNYEYEDEGKNDVAPPTPPAGVEPPAQLLRDANAQLEEVQRLPVFEIPEEERGYVVSLGRKGGGASTTSEGAAGCRAYII